jgi:hypothetical protein
VNVGQCGIIKTYSEVEESFDCESKGVAPGAEEAMTSEEGIDMLGVKLVKNGDDL